MLSVFWSFNNRSFEIFYCLFRMWAKPGTKDPCQGHGQVWSRKYSAYMMRESLWGNRWNLTSLLVSCISEFYTFCKQDVSWNAVTVGCNYWSKEVHGSWKRRCNPITEMPGLHELFGPGSHSFNHCPCFQSSWPPFALLGCEQEKPEADILQRERSPSGRSGRGTQRIPELSQLRDSRNRYQLYY